MSQSNNNAKVVSVSKYYLGYTLINRLKTQKREKTKKTKFHFVPSIFSSVFQNFDKHYDADILVREIEKLKIFYRDQNTVKITNLNSIENLFIDIDNTLNIAIDKKQYVVLTPTCKNHIEENAYENFILENRNFSDATIDHNPSFYKLMEENIEEFPNLKSLHEDVGRRKKDRNTLIKNNLLQKEKLTKGKLDSLWHELVKLHSKTEIELVHRKYNKRDH